MNIENLTIPLIRQVIYDTYANFPTAGLCVADLAWATDRQCLYRWSGAAWESIGISSRHGDYAGIGDPADYPESSLYQADDEDKLYMIMEGAWVEITHLPIDVLVSCIPTDDLQNSNDTERITQQTSYTKVKEVLVNEAVTGTFRIKFDLMTNNASHAAKARIYKNDVAIGTERSELTTSYQTYSEDLAVDLTAGDKLQLYARQTDGSYQAKVRNFRFYYGGQMTEIAGETVVTEILVNKNPISVTNQDPA